MSSKMMASGGMMKSKMMASGGAAKSKMGVSGGMKKKGYAAGGVADMASPKGKTETSSRMAGETVSVRGVGAARAQKATIY